MLADVYKPENNFMKNNHLYVDMTGVFSPSKKTPTIYIWHIKFCY